MNRRRRRWIQGAIKHPGLLHRQLDVPDNEPIPPDLLREAAKHPDHFVSTPAARRALAKRARLAMTLSRISRRRRRA